MYPTKFIIECLQAGQLTFDYNDRKLVIDGQLRIPYDKVAPDDWGYVYENMLGKS